MPGKQSSSIIDDQRNTPQYKRELALCKKAGGDIAAIFKLNLDLKQLTEVRKGLVAAVDIYKYMDPERPWVDMQEYRLELEQNVDLTKYRQQDYDVEQLAELRQGLVDGVDITQFDNKNYTPEQMKQLEKDDAGVQFSHSLEEQIGGQLEAGFMLLALYEDTNGEGRLHELHIPTFLAMRSRKPVGRSPVRCAVN